MSMTIEAIHEELSLARGYFPRDAVLSAREQKEAFTALILKEIDDYLNESEEDRDIVPNPLFLGIPVVAEGRETTVYRPLCRLLRCPSEDVEFLFGDALTDPLPRLLASLCDGDPQPLLDVILDSQANEWARNSACRAIPIAVRHQRMDKDKAEAAMRLLLDTLTDAKEEVIWWGLADAIADLGLEELTPRCKKLFDEGYISPGMTDFSFYEKDLRRALNPGTGNDYSSRESLWDDTIAQMEHWACFKPSKDEYSDDEDDDFLSPDPWDIDYENEASIVNPYRDIGRNDKCPCGSGKKFKKCCLEKAA